MKFYIILAVATVAVVAGGTPKESSSVTANPDPQVGPFSTNITSRTQLPALIENESPLSLNFAISAKNLKPIYNANGTLRNAHVKVYLTEAGLSRPQLAGKQGPPEGSLDVGNETDLGDTSFVGDTNDPEWTNVFHISWSNGTGQNLRFKIQDQEQVPSSSKGDEIGGATMDVDEYVRNNQDFTVPVSPSGELTLKRVEIVKFRLSATSLPSKDHFGSKSDPFAQVFWRRGKDGNDTLIGTSSTVNNEEDPSWEETFEFNNYQNGTDQTLHIKVWDEDSVTGNDLIGYVLIGVDPFVELASVQAQKLRNSNGKAKLLIHYVK